MEHMAMAAAAVSPARRVGSVVAVGAARGAKGVARSPAAARRAPIPAWRAPRALRPWAVARPA
eukprot:scaffold190317_cov30-Tisochrysis_lutea.AAC.2